ncbi:RidA family protein [Bryobacter aggregatus]|uniref:RidA family protein n=1 Tax=Bryobacter aggregatus TaxID=360054 RepID=UPI0004E14C93|nr:RidA family protein [Bryobacter aggregatus]
MSAVKLISLFLLLATLATAQSRKEKKEKKEPPTQVLELLPDPPAAIHVESSRLVFFTSPMSAKGLLSQQAKEALTALRKQTRGATFVKLRVFVAGRGDARRITTIVSEQFNDWKQPLPALSIVQVGALPLDGAQVLIEAIAEDRRPQNFHGIDWISSREVVKALGNSGDPNAVLPLLEESLASLKGELLAVSCFVSSLDTAAALDQAIATRFPAAARSLVQVQRATGSGLARCEAASRRSSGDASHLVLTGTLIGFGSGKSDAEQLETRLLKLLEANSAKLLIKRVYGVSRGLETHFGPLSVVEGVGSNEATVALEAVGVLQN